MAEPVSILDLDPESFEVYFREGQQDRSPEQNQFLLEAYRKRQSSLSPAYDAIEAANQAVADEGRRRLNILPFTVPQGMSFFDAIRAGEQEFAAPAMFMGTAESAANVVDMPSATLRGPVSAEARDQAAMEMSEFLLTGAAPSVARATTQGVDPAVVRMAGIGDNGGPPLEDKSRLSSGLYSPSMAAVRKVKQNAGTYQQLRSQILKAGGKEEELRFAGLDDMFAPDEKVTRQQLEDALGEGADMFTLTQSRATGTVGDRLDPYDSITMNQLVNDYVQQNIDAERQYFRTEVMPDMASENLISLQEYVTPADTPTIDSWWLDASRRRSMEREVGRAGYNSIDEYLESFPDARVDPFQGVLYDSLDDAIERGFMGDLETDYFEEAVSNLEETASHMVPEELARSVGYDFGFDAGDTTYSEYMTPGITNYRENRYSFNDPAGILSVAKRRGLTPVHPFGDSGETPNVYHVRGGDASVMGGTDNAYHVGEIQSDVGQDLRSAYSTYPEETPADRALINLSKSDASEKDWKQLQRMPSVGVDLRGNLVKKMQLDPDLRPLELEDFQSAVVLAEGGVKTRLGEALHRLSEEHDEKRRQLEEVFASSDSFDPEQQGIMRRSLEEQIERELREAIGFITRSDRLREVLLETFVPTEVITRIENRDWLSDEEIGQLYSEGRRVPAAAELYQTLAQRNIDPSIFRKLIRAGDFKESTTRTPQPLVSSTNRWVDHALKSELVQAANSQKSFFTFSNPDMVRRMTDGSEEGQGKFYGAIVPQRLKNILQKLDKDVAFTKDYDEAQALRMQNKAVLGPVRLATSDTGDEIVYGLNLTPTLRRKIIGDEGPGLPNFRAGGIVSVLPATA
jgi:SOS response regulatory protein OraA/RecX